MRCSPTVRIAAVLVLTACGRLGFDATGARDASTDAAAPTCPWGPFSAPVQLPGPVQSSADDWSPTPTPDELELYYYQFIGGTGDGEIVRATRPSRTVPFSAPERVTELNSEMTEWSVSLTADGLVILFGRRTGAATRLYEATRGSTADAWGAPALLTFADTSTTDESPWLSPDGLRLVFTRFASGMTTSDLYETTRPARTSPWAAPVLLATLSAPDYEDEATTSADGLEVFFTSVRPGGVGAWDVYRATRGDVDQPWSAPVLVPELSSARDDIGLRLSSDGRTMYFNYDAVRSGGANAQLWTATRACL
jgi:hypothetical protein